VSTPERTPRILFITRKWPPAVGGMETYSAALTENLRRHGNVRVRALPGEESGRPPGWRRLFRFVCGCAWHLVRNARQFDVVHFGDLVLWPLALAARAGNREARLFVSAHGSDIAFPLRRGLGPRCYGAFLKLGSAMSRQFRVIANSEATATLCRAAGFRVAAVVPLAVEVPAAVAAVAAPLPYVLFVGRLTRPKGCRWFIESVLPRLEPELKLVVAGVRWDPSESDALDAARVEFLGPVHGDELRRLRRNALAVIVPNVTCGGRAFEGFGLTAVETAADQGVLLASRLYGVVDAVIDGVTGFLLPPEDPEAWIAKIREVASWPLPRRQAFLQRAREEVRTHFTWDRVARQTLEAYASSRDAAIGSREVSA
jgi:glycosyltransferase involved in cell wall biosynthesis